MEVDALDGDWPLIGRTREWTAVSSALAQRDSVVLVGGPGVGKTRLAADVLASMDHDTCWVQRVVATTASITIPFGALARLLPLPHPLDTDVVTAMQHARGDLLAQAGDRRLLVWVDNGQLLDAASATILTQMAVAGEAQLVVSVRAGEPVPEPITMLWKEGLAQRVEIEPLDRPAVDALVESVLGAPIDRITGAALWRLSQGNPMFVRELVLGARDAGTLVQLQNLWTIRGQLSASGRLSEVVETRLERTTPDERSLLEVVALGEPIGIGVATRFGSAATLDALEGQRLVQVERSGSRVVVQCAHPIYAEVVCGRMPAARAQLVQIELADALDEFGGRRDEDVVRIATWKVQAGAAVDPSLSSEAARRALQARDLRLARKLAMASDPNHHFESALVLGEILFNEGKGEDADPILLRAYELASSDREKHAAAVVRGFNLFLAMHKWDEAMRFVAKVETEITDQSWRSEGKAARAAMLRISGDTPGALALAREVIAAPDSSEVGLGRALVVAHGCLVASGRYASAMEYAERAASVVGNNPQLRLDAMALGVNNAFAVGFSGDLEEGTRLARDGYEAAAARRGYAEMAYWGKCLGELSLLRGSVSAACLVLEETASVVRISDPLAMSAPVLGAAALAATLHGDDELASYLVADAQAVRDDAAGRARGARAARAGNRLRAAEIAVTAAERAFDRTDVSWGIFALHDAVRYGHPEVAIDQLRKRSLQVEGSLAALLLRHAESLLDRDIDELEVVANGLEDCGALMFAAEVMAQASLLTAANPERARRLEARAAALFDRCEGAALPPILRDVRGKILTGRESEIAQLAAVGQSSKAIAEQLFISVRTVDNHLASVYGKLAVSGRRQLASVFGLEQDSVSV